MVQSVETLKRLTLVFVLTGLTLTVLSGFHYQPMPIPPSPYHEKVKLHGVCGFPLYWLWIWKIGDRPFGFEFLWVNFILDAAFWTIIPAAAYLVLKKLKLTWIKKR